MSTIPTGNRSSPRTTSTTAPMARSRSVQREPGISFRLRRVGHVPGRGSARAHFAHLQVADCGPAVTSVASWNGILRILRPLLPPSLGTFHLATPLPTITSMSVLSSLHASVLRTRRVECKSTAALVALDAPRKLDGSHKWE
jgi:hypothetical protein